MGGPPTYLEELTCPCCIPALGEFSEVPPRGGSVPTLVERAGRAEIRPATDRTVLRPAGAAPARPGPARPGPAMVPRWARHRPAISPRSACGGPAVGPAGADWVLRQSLGYLPRRRIRIVA